MELFLPVYVKNKVCTCAYIAVNYNPDSFEGFELKLETISETSYGCANSV